MIGKLTRILHDPENGMRWETEDECEARQIQLAANDLANAKALFDRLVAHQTDRRNRLAALLAREEASKKKMTAMG